MNSSGMTKSLVVVSTLVLIGASAALMRSQTVIHRSRVIADVSLYDSTGAAHPIRTLIGGSDLTLVSIFSPECTHCVAEAKVWEQLSKTYASNGLRVIGAAFTTDLSAVRYVREEALASFRIFRIDRSAIVRMQADPLPRMVVVDKVGSIEFTASGHESTAAVEEWLKSRLAAKD